CEGSHALEHGRMRSLVARKLASLGMTSGRYRVASLGMTFASDDPTNGCRSFASDLAALATCEMVGRLRQDRRLVDLRQAPLRDHDLAVYHDEPDLLRPRSPDQIRANAGERHAARMLQRDKLKVGALA